MFGIETLLSVALVAVVVLLAVVVLARRLYRWARSRVKRRSVADPAAVETRAER